MAFLAGAAPIIAGVSSVVQGVGGFLAGQSAKRAKFAEAREEALATAEDERRVRLDARRAIGEQLASQYGNGFEGGSGSALDALRESQTEAMLDVLTLRRQGATRYAALRAEGKAAGREGYFSLASGLLGGASAYGKMKHDWAQARTGTNAPPPRGGG